MSKAQHRTPEHRQARVTLGHEIEQGAGWCVQGEPGTESSGTCLMESRAIYPGQPWAVAHNDAGTVIIGAAHRKCNASEAASRGNKARAGKTWYDRACVTCAREFRTLFPKTRYCPGGTCAPKRARVPRPPKPRVVHLCPNCGEPASRRGALCPDCGVERNRTAARNRYRELVGIPLDEPKHSRRWKL